MKAVAAWLVGLCLIGWSAPVADAHAYLDHAEPRVGSTGPAPSPVKIWFSEAPVLAQSSIVVRDNDGKQVDQRDLRADPNDDTLLMVSIPVLSAGTYTVSWQAVCQSHHHTHGSYRFTVKD